MRDAPILFSAPMVRALIEGRKTQTRRTLRLQPVPFAVDEVGTLCDVSLMHVDREPWPRIWLGKDKTGVLTTQEVRFAVGQRLWVKETWAVGNIYDGIPPRDINPGGKPGWCRIRYAATDQRLGIKDRSPLFMPRWASRLTLLITDVRVQRLQDISEADAIAEGATSRPRCYGCNDHLDGWSMDWSQVGQPSPFAIGQTGILAERDVCLGSAVTAFGAFISELHDPRWNYKGDGIWGENPFVTAVSFRVVRANIDEPEPTEVLDDEEVV